jgi:MFS family permease
MLWSAAAVSDVGTWVQLIVVGSLVAAGTGSAVRTGLVALATFMPQGISAPIGGLLADRFDRRKVFASALLLQAVMTSTLAIVLGSGVRSPGVLTVLILFGSAAGALGAPSYAAMQPDLVPPEELMAMVSLGVYSWNSGRIIGPVVGTLLTAAVGPAWTIGFNAVTFVVLAAGVWSLRRPFLPHDVVGGTVVERMAEGWHALRSTPGCWHGVVLLILFNITVVPFMGLIPIYAAAEYGGGTGLAGLFSSAQGVGAIIGGIIITVLATRFRRSHLFERIVLFVAGMLAFYAAAPNSTAVTIGAALLGAGCSAMFITGSAIIQRDAPPARRGRVMALMQACMGVSYGIGILTIGIIGDVFNLHVAFGVGAVGLPVGFWLLTVRSRRWRDALDGNDPAPIERRPALAA